jgi:predicted acetyltransferase
MAEFFVARGFRKRGVGAAAAREVWRRLPGTWEVRVLEGNEPACSFWAAAIDAFTGAEAGAVTIEVEGKRWRVFSFTSPGAGRARREVSVTIA